MEATAQTIRLDSNIVSMLSSKATAYHLSIEDYANQLLYVVLTRPHYDVLPKEQKEKRMQAVKALRGIIPDSGLAYEDMKQRRMEERYGTV